MTSPGFSTDRLASPNVRIDMAGRLGEFELLYRSHVAPVTAFFARRSRDPQVVADLTADTFVEAIKSFGSSPPVRGSERPWLFAIARHVYAKHCVRTRRREHLREARGIATHWVRSVTRRFAGLL